MELSAILVKALTRNGAVVVSEVEKNLKDISSNFPKKVLNGSVETFTSNEEVILFNKTIQRGIRTSRTVVTNLTISEALSGTRVALAMAQATFPHNISETWLGSATTESGSRVLQNNFVANRDFMFLDIYDPKAEKKVQASASFKIQVTNIFEKTVLPEIQRVAEDSSFYIISASYHCVFLANPGSRDAALKSTGCRRVAFRNGTLTCFCNHTSVFTALLATHTVIIPGAVKVQDKNKKHFALKLIFDHFVTVV